MIRFRRIKAPGRLALSLTIVCLTTSTAWSQTPAEAAVRSAYLEGVDAFNRNDPEVFVGGFGADVEMYTPTGWLRGQDAVRERFRQTFASYPAARMEIEELRARQAGPETVIVDFKWKVFPQGQGPAFHGLASGVYVLRNGQWVEVLEHETVTEIDVGAAVPPAR